MDVNTTACRAEQSMMRLPGRLTMVQMLAVIALALVLWAGLKPEPVKQIVDNFDKYTHVLGFAALALFWFLAFPTDRWPFIVLLLVGLGLIIELLQGWLLPARSFDWLDLVMDTVGVLLASILAIMHRRSRKELPLP